MKRTATVTLWDVMDVTHIAVQVKGRVESHPNQVAEEWIDHHDVKVDPDQVPEEWLKDALCALIESL